MQLPGADLFQVRASGIHGRGLFANGPLARGTRIVEYVGERISKAEANRRCADENPFIFVIDDQWDLDGSVEWNVARFMNHSCNPNCDAEVSDGRIWLVAQRDIADGEELSFNYSYDLDDFRDHPCVCGSPKCVGYIVAEEYFDLVRAKLQVTASGSAQA